MNAVARIEPEGRELTPMGEVQDRIAKMGAQLKSVLPSHIDPAKFQRVAMTAIQTDPALLDADRASLFTALTKAATDGLLPDKREGALTVANTKVKREGRDVYIPMVVWMPMVAGIVKKVRQSGEVSKMIAKAVYEKDTFDVLFGDDDRIFHKPFMDGHPGKMVGAYSIVHLKDGSITRDFMPMWRIEKAKAAAKIKYVWDAWPDEMAIKTVIRHHAKLLPQSTDIEAAFERDETQQFDIAATMLAGPQAPPQPLSGAMLLEQATPDEDTPAASPAPATDTPSTDAGQSTGAASNEDKARLYFDNVSEMVSEAQDRVTLGEIETRARVKLANRPELLRLLLEAIGMKVATLAAFDAAPDAGDGYDPAA
jgi:recombination protein RecT